MKAILLIAITFLFISCGKPAVKKPSNLISEDQMVDILYDIVLINSAKGINKKLLEKSIKNPKEYVYYKHNIDSIQFTESNAYYTYNSDTYKSIYDRLEQKLKTEKTTHEALIKAKKRIKDSIEKSKRSKIDTLDSKRPKIKNTKFKVPPKKGDTLQELKLK